MTAQRDYLAGSRIARGWRAAAGWLRGLGRRMARQALKNPAALSLRAAWKAAPRRVIGVGMTALAATNLTVLKLLGREVPRAGIVLRICFTVLGILCIAQRGPREKVREAG